LRRHRYTRAFFARELAALCKLALEEAPVQALDAVYQGSEVDFVRQILIRTTVLAIKSWSDH